MFDSTFHYDLDTFCDRYNINRLYVKEKLSDAYPTLFTTDKLTILISEIDLLSLLGLGSFEELGEYDLRREIKIKLT